MADIRRREQKYVVTIERSLALATGPFVTFVATEIPNFLRVVRWKSGGRWKSANLRKWCDADDILDVLGNFHIPKGCPIRVLVARFVSVETRWSKTLNAPGGKYIVCAAYEWISPQPPESCVRESPSWRQWLEKNDTQGDILSPRIDAAGE